MRRVPSRAHQRKSNVARFCIALELAMRWICVGKSSPKGTVYERFSVLQDSATQLLHDWRVKGSEPPESGKIDFGSLPFVAAGIMGSKGIVGVH